MLAVEAHEDDFLVVWDPGQQETGHPILPTGHAHRLHDGGLTEDCSDIHREMFNIANSYRAILKM